MKKLLLFLVLFIVGLAAIFLIPGNIQTTLTNESKVLINKPREEVWKKFTDSSKMGEWLIGFKSIETVSGEPNAVGSKYKIIIEDNGTEYEAIETVKEIVENEKFAFELDGEMVKDDIVVTLVDKGISTEVTQLETLTGKGFFWRAMFFWMQKSIFQRSQDNLNNLKKYIEEN